MASKKKQCLVFQSFCDQHGNDTGPVRCRNKIKPGSLLCREHSWTHRIVMQKCRGEAHSNPYIDHCMVCLPHWGHYPVAIPNEAPLSEGMSEV